MRVERSILLLALNDTDVTDWSVLIVNNNYKNKRESMYMSTTGNIFKKSVMSSAVLSAMLLGTHATLASAEDFFALEEVVVTAQKRAESLQDVPLSVQSLDGTKIKEANIQQISELSAYIPNFQMTETTVGNNVFIRGIGSGVNQGFEQSVGMFVDGIYAGRGQQFRAPFLDVARVEVLKGPQDTLFGKNTLAGAINITTERPTDEFEGELTATYGEEYDEQEYTGMISGPLSETVSGRLVGKYAKSDGYLENTYTGGSTPDSEESMVRASLLWDASDTLQVFAKVESGKIDTYGRNVQVSNADGNFFAVGGFVNRDLDSMEDYIAAGEDAQFDDKTTSDSFSPEKFESENNTAMLEVEKTLERHTLTSITGYSDYSYDDITDADFGPLQVIEQGVKQEFEQWSQEFRLTSDHDGDLQYVTGLFLQKQELSSRGTIDVDLSPFGVKTTFDLIGFPEATSTYRKMDQDTTTAALFGQLDWSVTEALSLTFGLRYGYEKKEATQSVDVTDFRDESHAPTSDPGSVALAAALAGTGVHAYEDSRSGAQFTPTLGAQYHFESGTMVYVRLAQGFKSGGYNEAETSGIEDRFEYDDEEATSFEVGSKMRLLDGAATLNTSVFYTEYENRQVSSFEGLSFVVGNAAKSISQGVEIDGRWRAAERLTLGLSMAYLDSTYSEFSNGTCEAFDTDAAKRVGEQCRSDLAGASTEYAPEWSASLNMRYVQPVGETLQLALQLDANFADDFYFQQDLDSNDMQTAETIINARLSLFGDSGEWEVALVGKNLTDKTITASGADIPLFTGAHYKIAKPPRTVKVQGTYRF